MRVPLLQRVGCQVYLISVVKFKSKRTIRGLYRVFFFFF